MTRRRLSYQIVFLFGIVRYESTAKNIFCIETRLAVSVDLSRPAEETQGYSTVPVVASDLLRVQARKPNVTILPLWKKDLCRRTATLRRTVQYPCGTASDGGRGQRRATRRARPAGSKMVEKCWVPWVPGEYIRNKTNISPTPGSKKDISHWLASRICQPYSYSY